MTIEKLEALEPLFGSWYVDSKLAEGRNSKVFKIYKTVNGVTKFQALKTVKFPSSDRELSRVIETGKFKTVNEYLNLLENTVIENMNKMLSLRTNPNIVRFDNFRIVRENSCFYVIMLMELLSPFSDCVKVESITKEQVVKISSDLCRAVDGFRNAGIMHHQIKPENIYVDKKGNFKLGDFGISNISDRIKTEASPYMAPEVYTGSSHDTSSDIYSIGVLMYKLLNDNRLPFLPAFPNPVSLGDREAAFAKQMRGEKLSAPAKADREMTLIISKALAFNQSDRYFNPLLMRTELERYLDSLNAPSVQDLPPIQSVPLYVPVTPVAPPIHTTPVTNFTISDEEEVQFSSYTQQRAPEFTVTDTEKVAFREAFSEEDENSEDEGGDSNKKVYIIVAAIIAVIALVVGILFFGLSDNGDNSGGATVQTVPPPTVSTTQAPTVATTTAPILTTQPTTETTTESTTETTTETTTTEITTETTTETTAVPTTQSPRETPILVTYNYDNGDKAEDGRVYTDIEDYTILQMPENEFFDEVVIDITTPLGENIRTAEGKAYVYEMSGLTVIQKIAAQVICVETEEDGEMSIACFISVDDGDFYYSPDIFQYYVCLEEGAIESDSIISLPLQLEV